MTAKIIIQSDDNDKQEMIDALQAALTEGEKFAKKLFDILVDEWDADKHQIDQIGLIEMGTGHFIDCVMKSVDLESPAEYIEERFTA